VVGEPTKTGDKSICKSGEQPGKRRSKSGRCENAENNWPDKGTNDVGKELCESGLKGRINLGTKEKSLGLLGKNPAKGRKPGKDRGRTKRKVNP